MPTTSEQPLMARSAWPPTIAVEMLQEERSQSAALKEGERGGERGGRGGRERGGRGRSAPVANLHDCVYGRHEGGAGEAAGEARNSHRAQAGLGAELRKRQP